MAPVVPVLLVAVAATIALLIVIVAYARVRTLRPADRAILATLRATAVLLVIGCLLRPGLVIASAVPQRNVLAVIMDDSRSMRIRDVNDGTRTAALQRTFADTAPLSKQLAEKFAIRRFRFAADASPIAGAADYNHLAVRSAAAIVLDRLLGDNDSGR